MRWFSGFGHPKKRIANSFRATDTRPGVRIGVAPRYVLRYNRSAKLDVLSGCARNTLRTGFYMFLHALTCFYMFLHVLGSFYMFLHVLSKKVVARFSGYFSNMWLGVAIYCNVTGQESSVVSKSPKKYMPIYYKGTVRWVKNHQLSRSRQRNICSSITRALQGYCQVVNATNIRST